jgi:hypothetical protein
MTPRTHPAPKTLQFSTIRLALLTEYPPPSLNYNLCARTVSTVRPLEPTLDAEPLLQSFTVFIFWAIQHRSCGFAVGSEAVVPVEQSYTEFGRTSTSLKKICIRELHLEDRIWERVVEDSSCPQLLLEFS